MAGEATTVDQGQQGGTPSGQNNQPTSNQQPNTNNQPQGQSQQPSNTQRPGADQNPGHGDGDQRTRGILSDLQKERQARQKLEQQLQQLNGSLESERRRVQALAGVNPQSEEEQEIEAVKARVLQLFPVLGKLTDEKLEQLMGLGDKASSIEEAAQHHWTRHGQTMLDGLAEQVSEEIGGDLTDRQRKALFRAYVAEAEADPEFLQRHNSGDRTLLAEFAKQWAEDWIEPVRKSAVQAEVNRRRPVPNGRDRNVNTQAPKQVDFKNPKAVEDAMVESFRSHGGRFDN